MKLLSENSDNSPENSEKELALSKGVDAVAHTLETNSTAIEKEREETLRQYENECREKCATAEEKVNSGTKNKHLENQQETDSGSLSMQDAPNSVPVENAREEDPQEKHNQHDREHQQKNSISSDSKDIRECASVCAMLRESPQASPTLTFGASDERSKSIIDVKLEETEVTVSNCSIDKEAASESMCDFERKPPKEVKMLSYQRKIAVLYQLLSACLADIKETEKNCSRQRKGYDARHRVALHLLATWLDVKWCEMVFVITFYRCLFVHLS